MCKKKTLLLTAQSIVFRCYYLWSVANTDESQFILYCSIHHTLHTHIGGVHFKLAHSIFLPFTLQIFFNFLCDNIEKYIFDKLLFFVLRLCIADANHKTISALHLWNKYKYL